MDNREQRESLLYLYFIFCSILKSKNRPGYIVLDIAPICYSAPSEPENSERSFLDFILSVVACRLH